MIEALAPSIMIERFIILEICLNRFCQFKESAFAFVCTFYAVKSPAGIQISLPNCILKQFYVILVK